MLHAAIPSQGWIKRGQTMQLKTNSGRNRLNILGAYSPDDRSLISLEGRESCDAERVVQLLRKIGRPTLASACSSCSITRPIITPIQ
jgi:hypothetical protein